MMSRLRKVSRWWVDRPNLDVMAGLLTVAACLVGYKAFEIDPLSSLDTSQRHSWYGLLMGTCAALLGFAVTAASIVFAVSPGPRLRRVLREVSIGVTSLLARSIAQLAGSTGLFGVLILADTTSRASWSRFASVGVLAVASLAVARILWLLARIVQVFAIDVSEEDVSPISLDTGYIAPTIEAGDYPTSAPTRVRRRRRNG